MKAAKEAEKVLMKYFNQSFKVRLKDDLTPVTRADQEAEEIIKSTIRQSFPSHSFLGKETGEEKRASDYIWIIDPMDGTKNFARGIDLFSTLIALVKDGEYILGVSNASKPMKLCMRIKVRELILTMKKFKFLKFAIFKRHIFVLEA